MKFLALIYGDESADQDATPADIAASFEAHGSSARRPARRACSSAARPAARRAPRPPCACATASGMLTDGPFAETREQLGGFYLLECDDLDEALDWAAQIPEAQTGASRCARSWTTRRSRSAPTARRPPRPDRPPARPRRPPVPARVGAGGRGPRAHPRRPRPRRGGGPGRVRGRARALAARRRARQPGGLDRHRGAQPRDRPDPRRAPRAGRRGALEAELRALGGGRGRRGAELVSPIPDERLRLIFTCCHPALAPEARVALTLRALGGLTTARGGARVPRLRARDGAADRAREAQDRAPPASRYELPRDADLPARLRACWRRSTSSSTRATGRRRRAARAVRGGDPARPRAVRADARRARGARRCSR